MVKKKKIISELEDVIYSSENKYQADKLLTNFIKLVEIMDMSDLKINIENSNLIKLIVKHKAYQKTCSIWFDEDQLLINNNQINKENVNAFLLSYFDLDKKKKE